MGFGIRIGPFWFSLSGRRRKRTSTRCQRCHWRTRLRGKTLCEVCDYDVRKYMREHTEQAWESYKRAKSSDDPHERVRLLKDAVYHFGLALIPDRYGYTLSLNDKPIAVWRRELKQELREAKRAAKQAKQAQQA
ncbi:MAG: hypothetical protein IRZ10_10395 [Thermoflavifilum sp.]|nr:hypothetical protein [Thermoflavifilum sp.]MCL6514817.1 hypothetical protein [Alicyclobacillus sp.]